MIALVTGVVWAAVVALVAAGRGPAPRSVRRALPGGRLPGRADRGPGATGPDAGRSPGVPTASAGVPAPAPAGATFPVTVGPTLGRALRRVLGRPADPAADARAGWSALAVALLLPIAPALAPLPVLAAVVAPGLLARRAAARHRAAVVDQVPDLVDLLTITAGAGLPVSAALRTLGGRPGGALGPVLADAAARLDRGATTVDALTLIADAGGPPVRPLVDALAEHVRYGSPLRQALDRVGVEARLRRRRHAEEAARRLPVTLLFPLVLTTLPAFALLTVVPLLAGSLGSLSP